MLAQLLEVLEILLSRCLMEGRPFRFVFFRVSATTVPETADDPDTFCVLLGFRGVSDNVLTTIEEEVPVPIEGLGLMRTILFGLFSDIGGLGPLDSSVT